MRRGLAIALFLTGSAQAQYYPPSDTASFPPRHAEFFLSEIDCGSGGLTTAGVPEGWIVSVSGAGAAVQGLTSNVMQGSIGLCQFNEGSLATNRAGMIMQTAAGPFNFGNGTAKFFAAIDEGAVSSGTETYVMRLGFMDSLSAEPTDGCFFRYTHSVNSGKWQIVARSNSVETASALDSGITFTGSQTRRTFGIVATSTSCAFYNDGAQTTNSPIATNVPTGNTRTTSAGIGFIKSVGTTDQVPFYLDYMAVEQRPTTARGWTPF